MQMVIIYIYEIFIIYYILGVQLDNPNNPLAIFGDKITPITFFKSNPSNLLNYIWRNIMIEDWQLRIWAEIQIVLVEVEAMKVANEETKLMGANLAYREKDFTNMAQQLAALHRQLFD